ncbi:GNAT family N-acetyltransferase [Virgibacillus kekensis]|uniref:GNAT family N-acetyltransferase n=1 Tax=Virgibacillus kekensis TaxID=202261 RepID=A0ABV9DNE5_9BACI
MIKIVSGNNIPIEEAANFIAMLNRRKEYHIGYCGIDAQEIKESMAQDITVMAGAVEKDSLVGFLGADISEGTVEVWGPFVNPDNDFHIASAMWDFLLESIPLGTKTYYLFPNVENQLVIRFAKELGFKKGTDQCILHYSRAQSMDLPNHNLKQMSEMEYKEFIILHKHVFPDTYYNGQDIIERISDEHQVFVIKSRGNLAGYVYVEVDSDYGEGSIEFIAVDKAYRGKGYGKRLLEYAVKWLFDFKTVNEITLCVAIENRGALELYRSIGFAIEHKLHTFEKLCL